MNRETPLMRAIELDLSGLRLPDAPERRACLIYRQQPGTFRTLYGGGVLTLGVAGMPDLAGILANGRALQLEVKTPEGSLSPDQRTWRRVCQELGALWICARSVEHARAEVLLALKAA